VRSLIALAILLAASIGTFLWRGLPATAELRTAHAALLARERGLANRRVELNPMTAQALAALIAERDRARAVADRRLKRLSSADAAVNKLSFAEFVQSHELLALSPMTPMGVSLAYQAARSPRADAILTAVVERLANVEDMELNELSLVDDGRARPVPGLPEWMQVEVRLVLTASLPEALNCLESLGPDIGRGQPLLTVETASLRRIEPERWGPDAQERHGPPVQLSATLAVYVPTASPGEG